ncbi:hypothetical protein FA15DRAFT_95597 [Coprinopsis marcescibilis]|uniref:Uncharacterized protein n=1 Tax=Coprinopsis marcescibilis TaxID=230819 RepID=A0A5C3KMQ2_COPMA|nr:hypothetical protein FA15DRAFT_95597 [Coprinopsis marcescibilis]
MESRSSAPSSPIPCSLPSPPPSPLKESNLQLTQPAGSSPGARSLTLMPPPPTPTRPNFGDLCPPPTLRITRASPSHSSAQPYLKKTKGSSAR